MDPDQEGHPHDEASGSQEQVDEDPAVQPHIHQDGLDVNVPVEAHNSNNSDVKAAERCVLCKSH